MADGQVREVLPAGFRVHHLAAWFKREFAGDLWLHGRPAVSWEPIIWAVREDVEGRYYGPHGGHAGRDLVVGNHRRHDGIATEHPCNKPISVVATVLGWITAPGMTVLDPFAGSGTMLRAALDSGRRAVGIELEERWCDLAVRRLAQGSLLGAGNDRSANGED